MTTVLLGFASPVLADEEPEKLTVEKPRKQFSRDVITRLDDLPETEPNWFRENIHTTKKHGLEFSHSYMTKSRRKLIFKVKGPLLRKKTPGLVFEIRF
jgi:hypothetical protein